MRKRRKTRTLNLGGVLIGGDHPVVIQSMASLPAKKTEAVLSQIKALARAGSRIVRLAVLDEEDARSLEILTARSPVPLVADIHFDYRLALTAIKNGIAGLRINPGNLRDPKKVSLLAEKAGEKAIPIRIGVNGGSLDLCRFEKSSARNMVLSALEHIALLEERGFYDIKVSLKASDIETMVEANRIFSQERDYPLHLGVTEAGTRMMSAVRSSIGIGTLLLEGIGDTLRVSVSGDPLQEIPIAKEILVSLGLHKGIRWISCPTCGRTEVNVEQLVEELEKSFREISADLTVAVMGCVVNGPGEAREANLALVGGRTESLLYREGKILKKIPNDLLLPEMRQALEAYLREKS